MDLDSHKTLQFKSCDASVRKRDGFLKAQEVKEAFYPCLWRVLPEHVPVQNGGNK